MPDQDGADGQQKVLEQCYSLLSDGRYEEGVQELNRVRDLLPGDPGVYFGLGIAYGKLGQPAAALREYERCASLAPEDAKTYLAIAHCYHKMGNRAFEQEMMDIAGETIGDVSEDPLAAGILAQRRKDYPAALTHYLAVVRNRPTKAKEMAAPIGSVLLRLGRNAEAREAYLQATALPQVEPSSFFNLGLAEQRLGNKGMALQAYKRAVGADPDFYKAYLQLISLEARVGHWGSAWRHFREALRVPDEARKFRDG